MKRSLRSSRRLAARSAVSAATRGLMSRMVAWIMPAPPMSTLVSTTSA
jgi:hypothetical protein